MNYYYFKTRNNQPYAIAIFTEYVNTDLNKIYSEMTEEQREFCIEHPDATVIEVWNCRLTPAPEPHIQTIEELREQALQHIDDKSRSTLGTKVDVLGFCDALASSIYASSRNVDSIYNSDEILNTADNFLIIGRACRERVKADTLLINKAETKEEIDIIVTASDEFFDNLTIDDDDNIEMHRRNKLREIDVYDTSEYVNGFFYNDVLLWLDKDTRTGLVNTLNSAMLVGRETINIWFNGLYITLRIDEAREMLAALEIYATDCYNVTAQHKADVNMMDSIVDIDTFDVTQDYPERLVFNTEYK